LIAEVDILKTYILYLKRTLRESKMEREVMMVWEGLIISDGKIGFYSPKHKHHAIDQA